MRFAWPGWCALLVVGTLAAGVDAADERCRPRLTGKRIDRAVALGRDFLIRSQLDEGRFIYAYDWERHVVEEGDSEVRQAGATWSLGLLLEAGHESVRPALEKALRFFVEHSATHDRRRFSTYPGSDVGTTGAVALLALAHIEHLRATTPQPKWSRHALDGYLAQLVAAHRSGGGFHRSHWHNGGTPFGAPSPYYDGEALLALVKAARYARRGDLLALALAEADAGHTRHVTAPLMREPDPNEAKGYYQWSSMAWFELATWSQTRAQSRHGDRLVDQALWMIDVHKTLSRKRNTAYAYEGLVPAFVVAAERGDPRRDTIACTIERGLAKLMRWQVGSPVANATVRGRPADPRALGGVQNHAREPSLRIDVTQHQTHALLLAKRLFLPRRVTRPSDP
jgi:hypothetical protein